MLPNTLRLGSACSRNSQKAARLASLRGSLAARSYATETSAAATEKSYVSAKEKVGFTYSIDGTVATISPSSSKITVPFNTVLEIQTGTNSIAHAVTFNLEKDGSVGVILLDNISEVRSGQPTFATNELLKMPVGFHMLGKVINPLGAEIPTGLFTRSTSLLAADELSGLVDANSPSIIQRQPVNYNMLTGYKVIDTLIPVGRGQRELILGDRQTGKTSIAVSTIINQVKVNQEILSKNNVLSVFVSIGQRCSNVARIFRLLGDYNAMKYTTIVAATAADPGLTPTPSFSLPPSRTAVLGTLFRNHIG
eukprot:NODE_300_length_1942_cov_130.472795_g211_i0.p1 GENE.NODE_300_length_1942_cov_130.472795_g211_i0~~NODE_300_length_1942_cov_130.472795_g211_i0.p1  ORF type:complete len:325 (+),score=85.04 NODE_300_length_1942_cov_130.472795_g211_i0:52-975(+)